MNEKPINALVELAKNALEPASKTTGVALDYKWKEFLLKCEWLPKEDIIEIPNRKIVIDTTEELFKTDDEDLQNCYLKLLKTAYHKDKQNIAHPAFPTILSQLSRDEAIILCQLKKDGSKKITRHVPMSVRSLESCKVLSNEFNSIGLFFQENWNLYESHLTHMNLITNYDIGTVDSPFLPETYVLKNTQKEDILVGSQRDYIYSLTDFGQLFVQACIPDDIDITQFDYLRKYQPK